MTKRKKEPLKKFLVLTGVALQMGITIYLFILGGKWLDQRFNPEHKLFLILGTLVGVAISLYIVLTQIKRLDNE